jgi:hypothetical protein
MTDKVIDPMFTKKKGKRGLASMPKAQQEEIRAKALIKSNERHRREREDNMRRAERLGNYNYAQLLLDAHTLAKAFSIAHSVNDDIQDFINGTVIVQNVIDYAQTRKDYLDVFKQTK